MWDTYTCLHKRVTVTVNLALTVITSTMEAVGLELTITRNSYVGICIYKLDTKVKW